jgi:hypothetical protein
VLLEATQQGRQPGPATDRDDPRPPREEALLVDELDERLVGVRRSQRVGQDPNGPVRPEQGERQPDRRRDEPTQFERQELEGQEVDYTPLRIRSLT